MCIVFFNLTNTQVSVGANREENSLRRRYTSIPQQTNLSGTFSSTAAGLDYGPQGTFQTPGTWLGVNSRNTVIAVTNRDDSAIEVGTLSRGLLGKQLLDLNIPPQYVAIEAFKKLKQKEYAGTNLLILSPTRSYWIAKKAKETELRALKTGFYCITTMDLNDPADPRVRFVQDNIDLTKFTNSAKRLLTAPEIIINDDAWGTIASSIILTGRNHYFYHYDNKPSKETIYTDYTKLLVEPSAYKAFAEKSRICLCLPERTLIIDQRANHIYFEDTRGLHLLYEEPNQVIEPSILLTHLNPAVREFTKHFIKRVKEFNEKD